MTNRSENPNSIFCENNFIKIYLPHDKTLDYHNNFHFTNIDPDRITLDPSKMKQQKIKTNIIVITSKCQLYVRLHN
jgi:hypothetical protein